MNGSLREATNTLDDILSLDSPHKKNQFWTGNTMKRVPVFDLLYKQASILLGLDDK